MKNYHRNCLYSGFNYVQKKWQIKKNLSYSSDPNILGSTPKIKIWLTIFASPSIEVSKNV
jgi:hypothetical protein